MSIRERILDVRVLMAAGRWEGALQTVLLAIAATSRKRFPAPAKGMPGKTDREAFETFFDEEFPRRAGITVRGELGTIAVAIGGETHNLEHILYKWFRCHLAHEGKLPVEVAFEGDPAESTAYIKGGDEKTPMVFSRSNLPILIRMVVEAPENSDEGFDKPPPAISEAAQQRAP